MVAEEVVVAKEEGEEKEEQQHQKEDEVQVGCPEEDHAESPKAVKERSGEVWVGLKSGSAAFKWKASLELDRNC